MKSLGSLTLERSSIPLKLSERMMLRFRKRAIVIEAFQMTKERRRDNKDWPEWLNRAWNEAPWVGSVWPSDYPYSDGSDPIVIGTEEGVMQVGWNDWIIQGVAGELYCCKPDIFEASYEPAVEPLMPAFPGSVEIVCMFGQYTYLTVCSNGDSVTVMLEKTAIASIIAELKEAMELIEQ